MFNLVSSLLSVNVLRRLTDLIHTGTGGPPETEIRPILRRYVIME